MGFQTNVNIGHALGVPGRPASLNPMPTHPVRKIAEVELSMGGFCWASSTDHETVINTGTGKPLGFVVNEAVYPIINAFAEAQLTVPAGANVTVALKGDFYVITATAATAGQKVFASLTDGSVVTGAAGATVADYAETDYYVLTDGDADSVIVISGWI